MPSSRDAGAVDGGMRIAQCSSRAAAHRSRSAIRPSVARLDRLALSGQSGFVHPRPEAFGVGQLASQVSHLVLQELASLRGSLGSFSQVLRGPEIVARR